MANKKREGMFDSCPPSTTAGVRNYLLQNTLHPKVPPNLTVVTIAPVFKLTPDPLQLALAQ